MKDLMKTPFPLPEKVLRLLGTEKIDENWLKPNFSNAFQHQKKNISIKTLGLKKPKICIHLSP